MHVGGSCWKFGNRLFTDTIVRASQKNAGVAESAANPRFGQQANAAMATIASSRVVELSERPGRLFRALAIVQRTG